MHAKVSVVISAASGPRALAGLRQRPLRKSTGAHGHEEATAVVLNATLYSSPATFRTDLHSNLYVWRASGRALLKILSKACLDRLDQQSFGRIAKKQLPITQWQMQRQSTKKPKQLLASARSSFGNRQADEVREMLEEARRDAEATKELRSSPKCRPMQQLRHARIAAYPRYRASSPIRRVRSGWPKLSANLAVDLASKVRCISETMTRGKQSDLVREATTKLAQFNRSEQQLIVKR